MRRFLPLLALWLAWNASAHAHGLLIPEDKSLPPLAMLNHKVTIAIDDQVASTRVEQTFRNHTDRALEATYVFPVPKGAAVDHFSMWVNDKEVKGEMVPADQARQIYTSIVRRTQDPGLLEYIGNNLFQLKAFPIPAKGDQKVSLRFQSLATRDSNLVEYIYPLKTDGKATATLEDFSIVATLKSQHAIQNVYSPTHAITLQRTNDRQVTVHFDRNQGLLDKDFQLFYSLGDKDVGLTALMHRPLAGEPGYFTLLISPKIELTKEYEVPRDIVLVLDTSGSMRGVKMEQARKALKYCLNNLSAKDRFGMINFATTVNRYREGLTETSKEQIEQATKWVDKLEATGGTAINDALLAALDLRSKDEGRIFTIVFFTDGQPTIGETVPEKILKNVAARNSGTTRIFTFGVGYGDGINASLLDQLADQSRAVSTYVRPEEDIETKVSGLYSKISHPVLANLKLSVTNDIKLSEIYPPELPDLFHGGQVVVMGRYAGKGAAAIKLSGSIGKETKEFVYETTFADKTKEERGFVEQLWARRKVGYLLDQIRVNGDKKELVEEVVALAKRYGIATPYTSYLIVPDAIMPVAGGRGGKGLGGLQPPSAPAALAPGSAGGPGQNVTDFARQVQGKPGDLGTTRGKFEDEQLSKSPPPGPAGGDPASGKEQLRALTEAKDKKAAYDQAYSAIRRKEHAETQEGQLGVELSVQMNNLRSQSRLDQTALRNVNGRNCMEIGGVWIDEGFDPKMKVVAVKAQSDAYFRILERQPNIKDVFRLGNHVLWVTPNGTALVIDARDGKEKLDDKEIDELFVAKKK